MTTEDDRVTEAKRRVARRAELRAEAAAEGMRSLPQDYRENLRRQFAEAQAEAKAIVKTYLRAKRTEPVTTPGLGAAITRLLDEHWPGSGVNGHYLADLLRTETPISEEGR